MKLFKRTSITLSILIILMWVFLFVLVYYPLNNIRITEVEREQTGMLLAESNIKVDESFLCRNGKALPVPEITYIVSDGVALQKACADGKIKKDADNEYSFEDSYITIVDDMVIIEGKSEYAENVTESSALSKAKKIVDWLKLSHKKMSAFVKKHNDKISVTFIPEYKGRMVFDNKIVVFLYKDGKYRVQSNPFEVKKSGVKQLGISSCTALAELAESDLASNCEIMEMNFGYKTDGNTLKPVWEIKVTDGNTFYVD